MLFHSVVVHTACCNVPIVRRIFRRHDLRSRSDLFSHYRFLRLLPAITVCFLFLQLLFIHTSLQAISDHWDRFRSKVSVTKPDYLLSGQE